MVVLDFLGQGQRAEPPLRTKRSPRPPEHQYATHCAMILENGPSPRHERTFVTRLHSINDQGSALAGNAVQGPIRFSRDKCGGANRNGVVFSPRNLATPPEIDAATSARHNERLRAAIAEARSARAKPPPRYRQYEGVLGRPLPQEARSAPRPVEPALHATSSHIVGTIKQEGGNLLPALPRVKVADEQTVRRLRASAFVAFKRNSDETPSEKTATLVNSARRRSTRVSDEPSSRTRRERAARRRRERQQAAEAAGPTTSQATAESTTPRSETIEPPSPLPDSPRRSRKQPAQMMSTLDRKTKLAYIEKQIGAVNSELFA